MREKNRKEYLKSKGIRTIAVYGMNDKGKRIYDELLKDDFEVFGIEKLNYARDSSYKIYYLFDDRIPDADAVIVIPFKEFEFVKFELHNFISDSCQVFSIKELEENT